MSFGMSKLGDLGEMSFGSLSWVNKVNKSWMMKLGELVEMNFEMLMLGE